MYGYLRQQGKSLGITFGEMKLLSNSRLAMEASEFARDCGKFDQFHEAIFHTYFTETQDIGQVDVITNLATEVGLEREGLQDALDQHKYGSRIDKVTHEAHQLGINAAPTFLINEKYCVVGAQPLNVFKDALTRVIGEQ
jgi:predicted DsbA family dithiol-disulfide isomerase